MQKGTSSSRSVIGEVSSYISRSGEAELPAEVIQKAKHHILDTLGAIVSGSTLKAGLAARKYAESQPGVEEAQVVASPMVTSAVNAALANGVMGHADETDDFVARYGIHPGAAIVPAALSIAEREASDGMSFLKGVVVGYDIGCRIIQALGPDNLRNRGSCSQSFGGIFGAAVAAASVLRLEDDLVRYVLSYASQQASGLLYWPRDEDHIEKGFLFSGMPAWNGVTAALLVQSGFTGVWDPFSGERNFFECCSPDPKPELLAEGLGSYFDIMFTHMKKFPTGGPIQAPTDALLLLMEKHGLTANGVQSIVVSLPGLGVADISAMPDINLRYLLAVTLLDGYLTFEAAHSYERMNDPTVLELRKRIDLVVDPEFSANRAIRQAIVEVTAKDGAKLREHMIHWRGTPDNPMTTEEVERKSRDLLIPVLGGDRSEKLIDKIWNLEQVSNMRELRPLLSAS